MSARTWQITLGLAIAFLLIIFVARVAGSPVSFDGAMNLQVAASLADGRGYARFYDQWILFPEEVQTNAPYILPAALVFALFGVNLLSAQAVSIGYAVGLVLAVFWLVRPIAGRTAALAATALVLLSPEFSRFGANGYGEAPGLLWFLLGLGLFCRALGSQRTLHFFAAGTCLGLAVLTKTVMLMPVGILLALSGAILLLGRRWKALEVSAFAFALPIAAFESWRVVSLGSLASWAGWWSDQLRSILAQAGVRDEFQNTPVWTEKLLAHASILADTLAMPVWLLPVLLLIPIGLALMTLGELKKERPSPDRILLLATLAVSISAYFFWWLLVTPTEKAWHRRIFNGLLLLAIAAPIVYGQARRSMRRRQVLALAAALPLLALAYAGLASFRFASTDNRWPAIQKTVEFMRAASPDATFYGFGWYSAPVFSLYSGRRIHDLATWNHFIGPDKKARYLLVDSNMLQAGKRELALRNLDHRTVVDELPWAEVVEITGGFRFQPMPAFDSRQLAANVNFLQAEYSPVQGFHKPEGDGWRWAEPAARIALARPAMAQRLIVRGYIPSLDNYRIADSEKVISLAAFIGDCALGQRRIEQSGNFDLSWSLDPCPEAANESSIVTLRANAAITGVDRPLSWIAHSIEFSTAGDARAVNTPRSTRQVRPAACAPASDERDAPASGFCHPRWIRSAGPDRAGRQGLRCGR